MTVAAEGLRKSYGTRPVVDGASFEAQEGESLGILRPYGAGKTTPVERLEGLGTSDSVGHLVEGPLIYPELTCRQNLALGARLHGATAGEAAAMGAAVIDELRLTQ